MAACVKTRIVRVVSAKFKAILIEGQACRLEFTSRADGGPVRFISETIGRPLASDLFDIAAP